jgi:hypothetical protein
MVQEGQEREDRMVRTGQLGQDNCGMPVKLGHDIVYDAGQDNPDKSVWTNLPIGQPG